MQTKNMTVGKPAGLILSFALPLMAGSLFQELYTITDSIIVGQFLGLGALSAIGAGGWVTWMLAAAIMGFSQGFAVPATEAFGAGDYKGVKKSIGNALALSILLTVILTVLGEWMLDPLLHLLDTPDAIFDQTLLYLRYYYAGCPIMMAYHFASCHLRALGNSTSPLHAMILAALVNIGLDLLFVGPLGMGIAGAVIATLIAQGVAAIFSLVCLFRISVAKITKKDLLPKKKLCSRLMGLGLPMFLQNVIISVGGLILQFIINQYSIAYIAGFTATNRLYGLLETAGISYGYAMTTFVGQNSGAGQKNRIQKGVVDAHLIGFITSGCIALLMILLGKPILSLFLTGSEAEVAAAMIVSYRYLVIMALFLPVLYSLHIFKNALVGLGNSAIPMVSGIAELVMRVGAAFFLPHFFSEMELFFAEPIAWFGAVLVLFPGYLWCLGNRARQWLLRSQNPTKI